MVTTHKNIEFEDEVLTAHFSFKSKVEEINGNSIHYVDEGKRDGSLTLLMHGVPTWSYMYRHMILYLVGEGHRVIAPDLLGFGRSSKPREKSAYSFQHLSLLLSDFISNLMLTDVLFFGHDWGALLGQSVAATNPEAIAGLALCNGYIPKGRERIPLRFKIWKMLSGYPHLYSVGRIVDFGTQRNLTRVERKCYNLPFSGSDDTQGLKTIPRLIPFPPASSDYTFAQSIWKTLEQWDKPVLTLFSTDDPITKGGEQVIHRYIPGTKKQNHQLIKGGHFLPEDAPLELAEAIHQFRQSL